MRKLILLILLVGSLDFTYSQEYDLVITNNGDSIVCNIDSIVDSQIFLEIKVNGKWIQSSILQSQVLDYQENAIDLKDVRLKPGTSYIKPSIDNYNRLNAIYFEFGGVGVFWTLFSYDRIIPITEGIAFVPRIGLSYYDEFYLVYEINFVAGGPHYFEVGFGQNGLLGLQDYLIHAGYRYHGKKGFLFKASPQLFHEYSEGHDKQNSFWLGVSLGYCF